MHPWVKGIQVCSNKGPRPFPRGDNYQIAKIHWRNLKIFFSWTTGLISTKLGTMHPWVKGIQVCSNEGPHPFPRGNNYQIAKMHWQNLKNVLLNHWANSTKSINFNLQQINFDIIESCHPLHSVQISLSLSLSLSSKKRFKELAVELCNMSCSR